VLYLAAHHTSLVSEARSYSYHHQLEGLNQMDVGCLVMGELWLVYQANLFNVDLI